MQRVRRLTAKECWRLQGFSDNDYSRAADAGVSESQLYKQAGNSIAAPVLYNLYKSLNDVMPVFCDASVFSLFSGIGAFEKALEMLKKEDSTVSYDIVNYSEIDKFASKAYSVVHNVSESKNLWDITEVADIDLPNFDILFGGSPCTDFSVAGKQKGVTWQCIDCDHTYNPLEAHGSGCCPHCGSKHITKTQSSLIVEYLRVLKARRPKIAFYENVKNIVSKEFRSVFDIFVAELKSVDYNVYWRVLNAKDYDVPQNRERLYLVAIRKDVDNGKFTFPEAINSHKTLQDVMDDVVSDKYYVSYEKVKHIVDVPHIYIAERKPILVGGIGNQDFGKQYRQGNRVYDARNIAMCLLANPVGNTGGNSYLYMIQDER